MWKRIKRIFINNTEAHLVSKEMSREELLEVMRRKKDVHLTTFSNGDLVGICNSCDTRIHILIEEDLVWYICPKCERVSFGAVENMNRDIGIAEEHGGKLEHEIYYFRDLPESLRPPKIH